MSDVQNFFLEALALIFVKVQYLYFRSKLLVSSIWWYQFPVAYSMYAEVTLIFNFFPIQTSIEQKCKSAPLVLHQFVRRKYLREDHSLAQTVV